MLGIVSTAYAVGQDCISLGDWCRRQGIPAERERALQENGAQQLYATAGERLAEMACTAVARALAQAKVAPHEVDVLVIYQTAPVNTAPMPFTLAGAIREGAGLSRAYAFAITQQMCVSPLHALRVLSALFERHPEWRHALLVGADNILYPDLRTLGDAGVHSDGAGAIVLGRHVGNRLLGLQTYNEPQAMQRVQTDPLRSGPHFERYQDSENYLWTLISVARRVLRSAGIKAEELVSVLPHNVNLQSWRQALAAMKIPAERLFEQNIGRVGHLFGSDIAVNLADSSALRTPGHHLVFASGVAGCFGGFILNIEHVA